MAEELPGCPFCGATPETQPNSALPGGRVVVTTCRIGCPMVRAYCCAEAWKRRTPDPRAAKMAESAGELNDTMWRCIDASEIEGTPVEQASVKLTATIAEWEASNGQG